MEDFRGDFASEEEALADLQKSLKDSYDAPSWAHLWDSQEDVVTNLNDFIRMNQAKKG